ncbi:Vegetative incompatibility protein HET-E-1 [Mollisiaceae sp. DMI_Dod_QoI]|nr:Vegetative incompatibility protein HET-E-1 [Helotiales sp. DMI_Dod_QoI]
MVCNTFGWTPVASTKSSSAELQEAVTCMFRWYRDASKCYVHLADVPTPTFDANDKSSPPSGFRKSRWFTRGWTLQELIAPASVEFFPRNGVKLGTKISLEQHIHDITRIPVKGLRGGPLSDFGIAERMAWMDNRETTRKEDKAYSLLGILDIQMPLLYGEGEERAFRRLWEEINKANGKSS